MTTLYGIKNCDTIKKAKKWLESNNIAYTFHDYRVDGISDALVQEFEPHLGWENLVNKRGTTFRQLDQAIKESLTKDNALALLVEQPAMIKRPVLKHNDKYQLGFKPDLYAAFFNV